MIWIVKILFKLGTIFKVLKYITLAGFFLKVGIVIRKTWQKIKENIE